MSRHFRHLYFTPKCVFILSLKYRANCLDFCYQEIQFTEKRKRILWKIVRVIWCLQRKGCKGTIHVLWNECMSTWKTIMCKLSHFRRFYLRPVWPLCIACVCLSVRRCVRARVWTSTPIMSTQKWSHIEARTRVCSFGIIKAIAIKRNVQNKLCTYRILDFLKYVTSILYTYPQTEPICFNDGKTMSKFGSLE